MAKASVELLKQKQLTDENKISKRDLHNLYKLLGLTALVILATVLYMTINVKFNNEKLFKYSMEIRGVKVASMIIVAFCIGGASMVFQSVINNTIVTPCLLGMNSLYTLIHTSVVFFLGASNIVAQNQKISFAVDLLLMGIIATFIYSYMFKKTKYNVLYVLLIGTVLSSFFSSIQTTMVRVMDPNEYDALLSTLVASFSNIKGELILISIVMMVIIIFFLRKDLALLDVITLGKNQGINLGVDYDRTIKRLLLGVVLFIAIATALVGPVSFLGLIIANLARQLLKTYRHTQLIAGSVLIGMLLLIGGQVIVEHVFVYAVPISVFITVSGGLYFLYLLLAHKGRIQ